MSSKKTHISVCICTYKRPVLLRRLLDDLSRQETEGLFTYSIVVAENDEAQAAKTVVAEFAAVSPIPVTYCFQPQRNIALTRNKAVENATGDFIAFIDDDEFPTAKWLLHLLQACHEYGADGVLGPVTPYFDKDAPRWIVKGGLFDRPSHPTGMRLDWSQTRTGNVLLKSQMFTNDGARFNSEFLSGSDQEFFKRRMTDNKKVFIWCEEAGVYEVVPPARWKRAFLIRRAVFRGVFSFHNRTSAGPVAWSFIVTPAYVLALPICLALGQDKFMRYLFSLSYHVGRLLAFVGVNPIKEPYVTD